MAAEKNEAGLYEIDIDGIKFEFEKWGAEESLSNLLKLSKIIGKPMGLAFGAFKKEKKDEKLFEEKDSVLDREIDFDVLGTAFEALTESLDESSAISLIKKLCASHVLADGAKINFNIFYADRLDLMFKVVYAALGVQYGNFFSAVKGMSPLKNKAAGIRQALRM